VSAPELSIVVVAWRSGDDVRRLAAALPDEPACELVVVDNSGDLELPGAPSERVRVLRPGRNLGFAGGSNAGAAAARGALLLFLNPDARPRPDACARLRAAFARHPEAAGLAPRLVGPDGLPQARWQLRALPSPLSLLAHAFFWNPTRGPLVEPVEGTPVAQPAAAALALRRAAFEAVGGFDPEFHPAWFEDVDLARRLAARGLVVLYAPAAEFDHRGGSSVPALGYGGFLAAYDRNLARYLAKHHGTGWALLFRLLVPVGALLRLLVLPLRRPRRTATRGEAARALVAVALGARHAWRGAAEGA